MVVTERNDTKWIPNYGKLRCQNVNTRMTGNDSNVYFEDASTSGGRLNRLFEAINQ